MRNARIDPAKPPAQSNPINHNIGFFVNIVFEHCGRFSACYGVSQVFLLRQDDFFPQIH